MEHPNSNKSDLYQDDSISIVEGCLGREQKLVGDVQQATNNFQHLLVQSCSLTIRNIVYIFIISSFISALF